MTSVRGSLDGRIVSFNAAFDKAEDDLEGEVDCLVGERSRDVSEETLRDALGRVRIRIERVQEFVLGLRSLAYSPALEFDQMKVLMNGAGDLSKSCECLIKPGSAKKGTYGFALLKVSKGCESMASDVMEQCGKTEAFFDNVISRCTLFVERTQDLELKLVNRIDNGVARDD